MAYNGINTMAVPKMTVAEEKAEELMNTLGKLLDDLDQNPEGPLFHYTSFEEVVRHFKNKANLVNRS